MNEARAESSSARLGGAGRVDLGYRRLDPVVDDLQAGDDVADVREPGDDVERVARRRVAADEARLLPLAEVLAHRRHHHHERRERVRRVGCQACALVVELAGVAVERVRSRREDVARPAAPRRRRPSRPRRDRPSTRAVSSGSVPRASPRSGCRDCRAVRAPARPRAPGRRGQRSPGSSALLEPASMMMSYSASDGVPATIPSMRS